MKYEVVPTELTERAGAWADFWTVTIQVPQPPSLQDTCIVHNTYTYHHMQICKSMHTNMLHMYCIYKIQTNDL